MAGRHTEIPEISEHDPKSENNRCHFKGLVSEIVAEGKQVDPEEKITGYTKRRRIVVIGPPGAGKSHMIRNVLRDLSDSESHDLLVVFQNFRDMPSDDELTTPWEVLFGDAVEAGFPVPDGYTWVLENQHEVVMLMDGLDQAPFQLRENPEEVSPIGAAKASAIISNIFAGKLLPGIRILYTSRQPAVAEIPDPQRPDNVISLTGLSRNDAKHIFSSFVGDEKVDEYWEKLQEHPLFPMLFLPGYLLIASIVCLLSDCELPDYFTSVMLNIFDQFKQCGFRKERNVTTLMKNLRKLAYEGMLKRRAAFFIEDFTAAGLTLEDINEWIIDIPGHKRLYQELMEPDPTSNPTHYFTKYVYQEILSAEHITTLPLDAYKHTLENDLLDNLWLNVITFLSGFLLNEGVQISDDIEVCDLEEKKQILRDVMMKKLRTADHATVRIAMLIAIAESNDGDYIRKHMDEIYIKGYPAGMNGAYAISQIVEHHPGVTSLRLIRSNLDPEVAKIVWGALRSNDVKLKHLDMTEHDLISAESLAMAGCILQNESVLIMAKSQLAYHGLQAFRIAFGAKKLKSLDLSGYTVESAKEGKMIGSMIIDQGSLCVAYCGLDTTSIRGIQEGLGKRKLKNLDIGGNRVTDEVLIRMVPSMIADNAVIGLRNSGVTSYRLWRFMTAMGSRKISELDVTMNTFDKDGLAVLGGFAKQCSIDKLTLIKCELNADSLDILSKVEGVRTSKIDISMNPLDERMIISLANLIRRWRLTSLVLQGCNITDGIIDVLIEKFKGLQLLFMEVSENGLCDPQVRRISNEIEVERVLCRLPIE